MSVSRSTGGLGPRAGQRGRGAQVGDEAQDLRVVLDAGQHREDGRQQPPDRDVVGEDVGDDLGVAARAGALGDRSDEPGADAPAVPPVDDLDGQVAAAAALGDQPRDPDRPAPGERADRDVAVSVDGGEPFAHERGQPRNRAVEATEAAGHRETVEHGIEDVELPGAELTDPDLSGRSPRRILVTGE
jgi:hypothetical protein